jgi:hypothetical protein
VVSGIHYVFKNGNVGGLDFFPDWDDCSVLCFGVQKDPMIEDYECLGFYVRLEYL